MKKHTMILASAALAASFGMTSLAQAATVTKHVVSHSHIVKHKHGGTVFVNKHVNKVVHKNVYGPVYPMGPAFGAFGHVSFGGLSVSVGVPAPIFIAPPVILPPAYHYVYERVWIEPVFEDRVVGYDLCGNPIVQRVLITEGSFRTAQYRVFVNGGREFVAYL
ncbi:MAG: hypothetical protein HY812_17385 [Planctomycetes bacterium]|nr:hypothetical protein [Planctomycetota bacterium]